MNSLVFNDRIALTEASAAADGQVSIIQQLGFDDFLKEIALKLFG